MGDYKHYIRTNVNGIVVFGFTSGFPEIATPQPGDLELTGYDQRQFQLKLVTDDERRQFKYKVVDGEMIERTQAELGAEWSARPAPPPSEDDRLAAVEDWILGQMFTI